MTLSRITLSKVSFSDLLENEFLDHSDTFEQIFDFYTFKNHTYESVGVSAHCKMYFVLNYNIKKFCDLFF